ncbi:EF-hand superfamily Ca2+-modulated protein [Daldinia childiae]|uniref:EF-hand superfamily Ca2+-modulated protein n=1 Tax=Daldinia childiae TaxID=326645 RepID=UPI00144817DA|nr:EF-hand superfamily Ca2+-modulated protein [Daldinia childiae]KAF3070398.1 EF-hand superfamily Ca2+-modulated protein [Daldinia childiae]
MTDVLEIALTREATDFTTRQALRRKGLNAACIYDSYEVAMELLNGREPVEVTARLVRAAIVSSSGRVITLILRNYKNMVITPDITTCATRNRRFGIEALKALKNHYGRLPADLGTYRSAMECSSEMLKYLLAQVDHPPGIEDIVTLASSGREESMSTVLHYKEDIPITQSALLGAARNSVDGHQIMKTLVKHTKANIVLSEEILCAVASNKSKGPMIFEYLFRALGNSVNITEAVLVSAAKSGWLLEDIINILKRRPDIPIPEAIISDVVNDEFHGDELIEALFNHDPSIVVSEDNLVAAAQNNGRGTKILKFLIQHVDRIRITPRVVAAAAANKSLGNELVSLLLAGILDLHIEDTVLEAAAGNPEFGDELIETLLYYDGNTPIGDRVMEAVARNKKRGVKVFALLLEHDPNIKISESMLKAAIANGNSKLLKVWLDLSNVNSKVSEVVVKEAIHDFSTLLVLLKSGRRVTITPEVLKRVAMNRHVTEIFPMLLNYDGRCPVTEAVLMAAIGNPNLFGRHIGSSAFATKFNKLLDRARIGITKDMLKLAAETDWRRRHITKILLEYQNDLDIEDILKIAARNDSYTQEMFEFLLEWDENCQITEDVVIAAARSSGGSMRALLECGRYVPITEAVLKTVASGNGWDATSKMALILNGQYNVEITEETKDYTGVHSSERPRSGVRLFGRLTWKAFRYATGIQIFIWAFRKIRSKTDRDTKKVGGSFYRKIDEEERGMKSGNEQSAMPPAQLRHEPVPPPAYSNVAAR